MTGKEELKALQAKARQLKRDVDSANWNGRISPRNEGEKTLSGRVETILNEFFLLANNSALDITEQKDVMAAFKKFAKDFPNHNPQPFSSGPHPLFRRR